MGAPEFRLNAFEGPLDLLLRLIAKNKVSIWDIPVTLIFEQYMEYIEAAQEMDMEIAGEFITMAATLMVIKSEMMLPARESAEAEDPRDKLARALEEYRIAKENAAKLADLYLRHSGRQIKEPEVIETADELSPHDSQLLRAAIAGILRRGEAVAASVNAAQGTALTQEAAMGAAIPHRPVSVMGKIIGVMRRLYRGGGMSFEGLAENCETRAEVIATFIAVLELLRSGRAEFEAAADTGNITFRLNRVRGGEIGGL